LSRYQNYDFDTIPAKISRYPILTIRYHKYDTILQLRYDTTNTIRYHKYDKILVYLSMIVINKTSVRFPFYQLVPAQLFEHFTKVLAQSK